MTPEEWEEGREILEDLKGWHSVVAKSDKKNCLVGACRYIYDMLRDNGPYGSWEAEDMLGDRP